MPSISIQKKCQIGKNDILLFRVDNNQGAYIEITNFGATLVSAVIPDKGGTNINRILSYENLESYFTDKYYLGATIGRVANRVSNAKVKTGGKTYYLDKNDGVNSNHGGFTGWNKKIFCYKILENEIVFKSFSKDGEGGFPGNMNVSITYSFTNKNEILIDYEVDTDKFSPVNMTNHAYFNLLDKDSEAIGHSLKVYSKQYLEFDENFLPTGNILPVNKTESYDFSEFRKIRDRMISKNENHIKGFNTYFIAEDVRKKELKLLAELQDESSTILLRVKSTMPGVQLYTGDYLGGVHTPFSGVCLEAQYYPDFVNHKQFPNSFVNKGSTWKEKIVYEFTVL